MRARSKRRLRWCAAVVIAALAPAAGLAPARAASVRPAPTVVARTGRFGFSQGSALLWESDSALAADLDGMAALGASWVAVDVDWPSIQADGPSSWNWGPTDRVVFAARARNIGVLALAVYTPSWARPAGTTDKHPPTDAADYARFVAAGAARYAPLGVHTWQIWNEPNVVDFWEGGPDPARYAGLAKVGADAIHAADPSAVVLSGGLAPATTVPGRSIDPNSFLFGLYRSGIRGHIDAVAMHPYSFPYAPTTPATWNPFYMLAYTHLIMAYFGDGALPIWATEAGFGTGRDASSVSEATQAVRVGQLVAAWRSLPYAGALLVYGYRDLGSASPSVFDHMGVVRADRSAKPALTAFRRAIAGANALAVNRFAPRVVTSTAVRSAH